MAVSKKAISFGLVHIPIELNTVIRNNDTSFNQLHIKCGSRIKHQKVCPHCNTEVKSTDLIKGYQYSTDKYVTFTDEDFDKMKLNNNTAIEIVAFINKDEVNPIYYDKSYYLTTKNNKAFSLLIKALEKERKIALAKTVIGTKFYYVVLRADMNNLILNTLYFDEEINLEEETNKDTFTKEELDMATKLIKAMTKSFEPEKYKDEYQDRIRDAINKKIEGKEITKPKEKPQESIKNLMQALKLSLKETKK